MRNPTSFLSKEYEELVEKSLDWRLKTLYGPSEPVSNVDGREVIVLCSNIYWFGSVYYRPLHQVEILNAVTGWGFSVEEYMNAGERINTYCRAFNVREGITRKDDILPRRFMEPLVGGPTDGQAISQEELDSMLDSYYEICGWDKETGIPTKERLNQLGLGFINL